MEEVGKYVTTPGYGGKAGAMNTHSVGHKSGNGTTNLIIVHAARFGPHEDEDESDWQVDLSQVAEVTTFSQPNKSHDRLREEVHSTHQYCGGFSVLWDAFQDVPILAFLCLIHGIQG